MKKISLLSTARASSVAPHLRNDLATLREGVGDNPRFELAAPEAAEVILVAGTGALFWSDLLASDLYARHFQKLFVLDFTDAPIHVLPGIYATLPEGASGALETSFVQGFYPRVARSRHLEVQRHDRTTRLGWFRGALDNHPTRRRLLEMVDAPGIDIEDGSLPQRPGSDGYAEDLLRSKFVLCPRGLGPSSFRVFEAMRLGRAPVIISDAWREPPFIDWPSFSLRVSEDRLADIPDLLRQHEPHWQTMGRASRAAWEANFSTIGAIDWIVKVVAALPPPPRRRLGVAEFLRQMGLARAQGRPRALLQEHARRLIGRRTPFQAAPEQWFD